MINILHVRDFVPMDKLQPNTATVRTTQHKRLTITLLGEDPHYTKYVRAVDREGTVYQIRKKDLYLLLTGRRP